MYALFQYRQVPHPLLTLVCQHHPQPWTPGILERLGVAHSSGSGKRELTRLLGEDRVVVLPVARGTIPWLAADPLTDREEHIVLALPGDQSVRVFDGTGSHTRLGEEALVAGYLATGRKHPLVWLDEDARLPDDLRPGLERGLRATVAAMTGPVLGNSFDVNFGLSGLRKWGHAEAAGCFDRSARHWRAVATAAGAGDRSLRRKGAACARPGRWTCWTAVEEDTMEHFQSGQ